MYVLEFGEGDGQRKYACEFCSYSSAFKANVKGGKSDGRKAVFRIRIQLGQWVQIRIRNPDPGGQKCDL
jgi:hypothetical protein